MAEDSDIQFPAIMYNERFRSHLAVRNCNELRAFSRWPQKHFWIPGGILDAKGMHIKFADVLALPVMPFWMKPVDPIWGSDWYLRGYLPKVTFEKPVHLPLSEYKEFAAKKIGHLSSQAIKKERQVAWIAASSSYEEVIYSLYGKAAFSLAEIPWTPPEGSNMFEIDRKYPDLNNELAASAPAKPILSGVFSFLLLVAIIVALYLFSE